MAALEYPSVTAVFKKFGYGTDASKPYMAMLPEAHLREVAGNLVRSSVTGNHRKIAQMAQNELDLRASKVTPAKAAGWLSIHVIIPVVTAVIGAVVGAMFNCDFFKYLFK